MIHMLTVLGLIASDLSVLTAVIYKDGLINCTSSFRLSVGEELRGITGGLNPCLFSSQ